MARMLEVPENLEPYIFLGIDLDWKRSSKNAYGDCPFCGGEEKFSVLVENGKYRCVRCADSNKENPGTGGNISIFIRYLIPLSDAQTKDYSELLDKKLLRNDLTLCAWQVCRSIITTDWLIPGYNEKGKLQQVYKFSRIKKKNTWRDVLLPTPGLGHKLYGVNLYKKKCQDVWLCEGLWDAMALWELFGKVKMDSDDKLQLTASNKHNLLANANVLGVPASTVFNLNWIPLFANKDVFLCYDNDRRRKNKSTGKIIEPAGLEGMKRIAGILSSCATPPHSINMIKWKAFNGKIG